MSAKLLKKQLQALHAEAARPSVAPADGGVSKRKLQSKGKSDKSAVKGSAKQPKARSSEQVLEKNKAYFARTKKTEPATAELMSKLLGLPTTANAGGESDEDIFDF